MVEKRFGTGAHKNKLDLRDHKWEHLARALEPFDWEKGYDIEVELQKKLNNPHFRIPVKNQGQSSSCVGQASAYYESVQDAFEKGVYTEKSARDAYSQIFYPGGGSSTRDALNLLIKKGVCKESLLKSYQGNEPPSESFIENRTDASTITVNDALTSKGTAYATIGNKSFDGYAQAARDNHGMLITVSGQNNGTWFLEFPKIPYTSEWKHELYVGKAKMINGKKYIGVLNSWGTDVGDSGWQWLGEDYLPYTDSGGVIYDTSNDVLNHEKSLYQMILDAIQNWIIGQQTKVIHT